MYIDTSCLVAYYLPEPSSKAVQDVLLNKIGDYQISSLTEIEMLSAFRKKVRSGDLTEENFNRVYQLFRKHLNRGIFDIYQLGGQVIRASELLLRKTSTPLRTLDALHLGVVYEYSLDLLTIDTVLKKAAEELHLMVYDL